MRLVQLLLVSLLGAPAWAQDGTTVRVVDLETRAPIAGAEVRLREDDEAPWGPPRVTDALGRVAIEERLRGCLIHITREGWLPGPEGGVLRGMHDGDAGVELALGRPATVDVRVAVQDAPLAGARLWTRRSGTRVQGRSTELRPLGSTDADGRCSRGGLWPGRYDVQARVVEPSIERFLFLGEVMAVSSGGAPLEINLPALPGRLRVQVTTGGRPLPAAAVLVTSPHAGTVTQVVWGTTDASGRLEVALQAGTYEVWTPGIDAADQEARWRVGEDAPRDVRLEVAGPAHGGLVVDSDGWLASPGGVYLVLPGDARAGASVVRTTSIGLTGRFEFPGRQGRFGPDPAPPGRYRLVAFANSARAPEASCAGVVGPEVVVGEGASAPRSLRVTLDAPARLRVVALREDGRPVTGSAAEGPADVGVKARHLALALEEAGPVDELGRRTLAVVPAGPYAVAGCSPRRRLLGASVVERAIPGQTVRVAVVLRPVGRLVVAAPAGATVYVRTVHDGLETPLLRFDSSAGWPEWADVSFPLDAGLLTLDGVHAATHVVRGTARDGRALGPVSVLVPPGGAARCALE